MSFGRTDPSFVVTARARAALRKISFSFLKGNGSYRAELVTLKTNLIAWNLYAHLNVAIVERVHIKFYVKLFSKERC